MPKRELHQQRARLAELAADRRPQADRDAVPDLDYVLLLYRRSVRGPDPAGTADAAADLVASDTYNKFFTMHGIIMVFLFLVPSVPATLGNFLIPIMLGAKDLAFPKINLLSWYLYLAAASSR
jgi:hypothetical protein